MSAGKGDRPRPIDKKKFDENFDQIQKNDKHDEEFKQVKVKGKLVQRKVYK